MSWAVLVARHLRSRSNYTVHDVHIQLHDTNTLYVGFQQIGEACSAPMRLPLVAAERVARGRCWWESCDITGTQSRVSHARTRATTICVRAATSSLITSPSSTSTTDPVSTSQKQKSWWSLLFSPQQLPAKLHKSWQTKFVTKVCISWKLKFDFYRTLVYLGFDLWTWMSVTNRVFVVGSTDVTLSDEDAS